MRERWQQRRIPKSGVRRMQCDRGWGVCVRGGGGAEGGKRVKR